MCLTLCFSSPVYLCYSPVCATVPFAVSGVPFELSKHSNNGSREKVFCKDRILHFVLSSVFRLSIMHVCHLPGPPLSPSLSLPASLPPFDLLWLWLGESFDFSLWLFYDSLSTVFGSRTKLLTHCETEGRVPKPASSVILLSLWVFFFCSCSSFEWQTQIVSARANAFRTSCLCTCQYFFEFSIRSIAKLFSIQWLFFAVTTLLGKWNNFILK